jgi:pyruvate dehydrogenase E1 component beta subunit
MQYKEELERSMNFLAEDPKTIFIGYGVRYGGKAAGTLNSVSEDQLIEMPVAENLMLSSAIGLALEGYKPVVFYERFDFIMNAMDALVNHLDKVNTLSSGEYNPKVIIRCVVGGREAPFFTGITHTQDFTSAMKNLITFPVVKLTKPDQIYGEYERAYLLGNSSMIIEEKDLYGTEST